MIKGTQQPGSITTPRHITEIMVNSPAFENNGLIPAKYACDGFNVSPPISIEQLPEHTESLVLIVENTDIPSKMVVHWLAWNIPATSLIGENNIIGVEGTNHFQTTKYVGPCAFKAMREYRFSVYALDTVLALSAQTRKETLVRVMKNHIIGCGKMTGYYRQGVQSSEIFS
jgi:Raf kinase inhibitor-like YbhB/YbcL family protein